MNGPKTVRGEWRTDYTMPYVTIGAIAAAIVIVALMLVMRNRKRGKPKTTPTAQAQMIPQGLYPEYLAKLDRLKAQGTMSEEIYRKLRKEYEERISSTA
jgi:hypothetical protein